MPTDKELMQQALDAMLNFPNDISDEMFEAMKVLKARLAQPEPTLALWNFKHNRLAGLSDDRAEVVLIRQREWHGLTDEEINDHWINAMWNTEGTRLPIPEFARAIEAKLKEKNGF